MLILVSNSEYIHEIMYFQLRLYLTAIISLYLQQDVNEQGVKLFLPFLETYNIYMRYALL